MLLSEAEKPKTSTVKIGAVYPLSGTYKVFGKTIQQAVELAVDIVNHHYHLPLPLAEGKGLPNLNNRKIEVIWADSKSELASAREGARRLIEEERVVALIGSFQSLETHQVSYVAEALEIPYVNPDSSAHVLTNKGLQWFFRTCATDTTYTKLCFDFLRFIKSQKFDISSMAILSEDTMTGSVTIETEMQYICNYGYELSDLELYTSPVSSLNHELNRISEDEPRVIFGQQYLDDAILTLKTLEKLDFYPDALIADSVGYTRPGELKKAGADGNFVISRLGWALGLGKEKPLIYKVNDLYRERYGENMDETNARSFTGFLVLADAINRAGSTNHYDIRDALRNTFLPGEKLIMPWEGVKFDEHGQNILAEGILGQIQNNRFRIIWPKELAETHVIWPAPSWDER